MIGGGALLVAAIGAATAGQAISSDDTRPTAAHTGGNYVATMSSASLEGRDATQVSRGSARPSVATGQRSLVAEAKRQARARVNLLRSAADSAQDYARELSSHTWVLPTSGFHISVWFGEAGATGPLATTPASTLRRRTARLSWRSETRPWPRSVGTAPYGNQIRLQFDNGDQVWYNHLSAIEVTQGQAITKGQEIGRVGETGNAFGYHLHFEYRLASDLHTAVDPLPYFVKHGIALR